MDLDARNRIMIRLRVNFHTTRFLNRPSEYANLFRMQGMLALARCARRQPPTPTRLALSHGGFHRDAACGWHQPALGRSPGPHRGGRGPQDRRQGRRAAGGARGAKKATSTHCQKTTFRRSATCDRVAPATDIQGTRRRPRCRARYGANFRLGCGHPPLCTDSVWIISGMPVF